MQSPIVVGIASMFPGLGFVLLEKYRWAANAFLLTVGLFAAGLFIPNEFLSKFSLELSGLAWIGQIYYAVHTARLMKKQESGQVAILREGTPLPATPAGLSRGERLAFKVAETLRQQSLPGEVLKDAMLGVVMPSMGQHMLFGAAAIFSMKQYYIGLTNQGLALLELDGFGKPMDIRRLPSAAIDFIDYEKGFANDTLEIGLKDGKPLRVKVSYLLRKHTQNVSALFDSVSQE